VEQQGYDLDYTAGTTMDGIDGADQPMLLADSLIDGEYSPGVVSDRERQYCIDERTEDYQDAGLAPPHDQGSGTFWLEDRVQDLMGTFGLGPGRQEEQDAIDQAERNYRDCIEDAR